MPRLAPHLEATFQEVLASPELIECIPADAIIQQISEIEAGIALSYLDGERFHFAHFSAARGFRAAPSQPLIGEFQLSADHVAFLDLAGRISILCLADWTLAQFPLSTTDFNFSANSRFLIARTPTGTVVVDIAANTTHPYSGIHFLDCDATGRPCAPLDTASHDCPGETTHPAQFRRCVTWQGSRYAVFHSITGTIICATNSSGHRHVTPLPHLWFVGELVNNGELRFSFRCGHHETNLSATDLAGTSEIPQAPFVTSTLYAGTQEVPVTVFSHPHDLRDTIVLTVHGGFGAPLLPFSSLPVTQNLTLAFAHVRGGGELGADWALKGRGENKPNALCDLATAAKLLRQRGYQRIILSGASHGGWLALVTGLRNPELVDGVSATCPIVDLPRYLATELGQKHRVEFPADPTGMDPATLVCEAQPSDTDLLLVVGDKDSIVQDQDFDSFCARWKRTQGTAVLLRHRGGHYAPPSGEIDALEERLVRFVSGRD
ncbi:prolyl oligopeptidase family serine peptidase [Corynebacterium hindlerae]|uniref:Prolyl oligopeptidase family serine peptidase n=1 Tax=Corynebacterium hindlerae TaxID=699041 RepID=A0A7G5FD20_9CORY|nr:prolyl oligopeptidase family serine peptidase [Corynebacterium hindlerae]QMV84511.1 prolyl oligopeptidase family serine peptidase [Corynebacterium hindlerae]